MSRFFFLPFMLLMMASLSGCIRDDIAECPPLTVTVDIRDRNYFNVDEVELEERLPADLPFAHYMPTVHWTLRSLATGEIVDESELISVAGSSPTFTPDICGCIPHGEYVLTVWGGLESFEPLSSDLSELTFHPGEAEGRDIFLTNDTLLYDAWHDSYTVYMERTKGKLIIEKTGLPDDAVGSTKRVTGLFGRADRHFSYSGFTAATTHTPITPAESVVTETLLAPSVGKDASAVSLTLDVSGPRPTLPLPHRVNVTMRRNELTVLRYAWNDTRRDFDIFLLVNGAWEVVYGMEVD
ncbi:MAG: hypothetical protein NC342_01290 [Pseudoflavonifractor sp.]|nr:hypothetical protein [Alloprevotella sp.]MCM1116158.1 hypothetical protein [Pseudoflavonifractor sp.]